MTERQPARAIKRKESVIIIIISPENKLFSGEIRSLTNLSSLLFALGQHEYRPSPPPPPPPPHTHCESGVKSSGQLHSHEISSQHINFTKPFQNTPHIILAASMAAKYRTVNGTQQQDGPADFHLRKRHVTPQSFIIDYETSADEDTYIFASWMACGKSF